MKMLDLKTNGELLHSWSIFCCVKDVLFVTENPDAGSIYVLSHLLLLCLRSLETELYTCWRVEFSPQNLVGWEDLRSICQQNSLRWFKNYSFRQSLSKFKFSDRQLSVQKLFYPLTRSQFVFLLRAEDEGRCFTPYLLLGEPVTDHTLLLSSRAVPGH